MRSLRGGHKVPSRKKQEIPIYGILLLESWYLSNQTQSVSVLPLGGARSEKAVQIQWLAKRPERPKPVIPPMWPGPRRRASNRNGLGAPNLEQRLQAGPTFLVDPIEGTPRGLIRIV